MSTPTVGQMINRSPTFCVIVAFFRITDKNQEGEAKAAREQNGSWVLLQRELKWIYLLKATSPPGLNEAMCFKPLLEGFNSGGMEK